MIYLNKLNSGQLRKWSSSGDELALESGRRNVTPSEPDLEAYHALHRSENSLVVIDNNQNIHFIDDSESLVRTVSLNGNMEEVLSTCWLSDGTHFAAATNSPIIQVRNLETGHSVLLEGHTAAVLAVDSFDQSSIVSASRDHSIKVWTETESGKWAEEGSTTGHSGAITCVKFFHKSPSILSCSEDKTVKMWNYSDGEFTPVWSQYDHEKIVNNVDIAPNDKLVASASADKTVILYRTKDGAKLGTFEGHKKGVWVCKFSPIDQVIATGSADG